MPLYEYTCRTCHERFELLVRYDTVLACTQCGGLDIERALSTFAVDSDGTRRVNLSAGRRHIRKEQIERADATRRMIQNHDD